MLAMGHIEDRGKRWRLAWELGEDAAGRRKRQVVYLLKEDFTLTEARQRLGNLA